MGGHLVANEFTSILNMCKRKAVDINAFIETGTYKGHSSREAAKMFDRVITIELSSELYNEAKELSKEYSNINFHNGDTVELLPGILENIEPGCFFFFLDAHQSGSDTTNNGENVPLLKELSIILDYIKSNSIIVIDDLRLFEQAWDWAGVSIGSIRECFRNHNVSINDMFIAEDRLIINI